MTVGELRKELEDLPDGAGVTVQVNRAGGVVMLFRWRHSDRGYMTWLALAPETTSNSTEWPEVGETR